MASSDAQYHTILNEQAVALSFVFHFFVDDCEPEGTEGNGPPRSVGFNEPNTFSVK